MITISETTPPKSSYENILNHPLTIDVFEQTLSQIGIQEETKTAIIREFKKVVNEFTDSTYTGDIKHFKVNLYTTLSETDKEINLVDVLSTEEFVARSTEMIKNLIYIQTIDNNDLTLEEYIRYYSKNRPERHHILPVLRGLYRREPNNKVYRDTSELAAALKKHIITHTADDSTQGLSSLVEKSKQNESVLREDESHYNTIKFYTESLPENSEEYSNMIKKIKTSLEYFSNSIGYKKEKLDKIMFDFLKKIANKGLSVYEKEHFGSPLSDLFNVEFSQKIDISELADLIKDNDEYKDFFMNILKNKKEGIIETIKILKKRLENFIRPTREERCSGVSYMSPIKSDQEYGRELGNLKSSLDMEEKNLALFESYIENLQNIDTAHNSVYHEIDDMPPEEKIRP